MTSTYAAHIVTSDAEGLGDPEVIVMTADDGSGADALVSYPLPAGSDPTAVLHDAGWTVTSGPADTGEYGYYIVDVEPCDWPQIVKDVTFNRSAATAELERQETAWRTVIRAAMYSDSTTKTEIAEIAEISRERAYQIRDGRR